MGIHTIIWCDSVNNMNRTLDRQGMKEFENRILFQMSANDSSTLIDTPAGQQAGREPGPVLQRGRKPDREVPALRNSRARVARRCQEAVCIAPLPAAANGQVEGPTNGPAAGLEPATAAPAPVPRSVDGNGEPSPTLAGEPVASSAPSEEVASPPVETL